MISDSVWSSERSESRPGSSGSLGAILLAVLPLIQMILILSVAFAQHAFTAESVFVTICLFTPVGLLLAVADQRLLNSRGYIDTGSPYWALIPVMYLFLRGYRAVLQNHEGLGPAWIHSASLIWVFATFTIFWPWIKAFFYLSTVAVR